MSSTTGDSPGRPTVFISYSQKDEAWKDRVVSHLKVLEVEGDLAVWDDKRIAAGEDWWPEIEGAMNRAAVAVLLISKDFLTSGFIRGTEVPRLLARRQTEGLRVIPVFVHPCAWEAVDWLAALQGRPGKGRTLSEGRKPQIEKHLSALALEIRDLLNQRAPGAAVERTVKPSSHPTSERRQVTVMCCELVGTEGPSGPAQAFDPETLQELMLQLRALAEGVAGAAGLLPLVGREQELELLLSRWSLAREGKGQAILISGEAGMGKSRLVRALRERLKEGTAQWWSCFGSPYTQGSPLQPVVALLRQVFLRREGVPPLDQLAGALQEIGLAETVPLLASLLDVPLDERHPAPPLSPERQREKAPEAPVG